MNIKSTSACISKETIDCALWAIQRSIMKKHGVDASERFVTPLLWYVNTGRASTSFLHKLIIAKPFMIGRVLVKHSGTYEDAIGAVKAYIGYQDAT